MAMAGVFGGMNSGIKDGTTDIFLESRWFNPTDICKTFFRMAEDGCGYSL